MIEKRTSIALFVVLASALVDPSYAMADRRVGNDFDNFHEDSLKAMGVEVSTPGLIAALKNSDANIRATATMVLGNRKEQQALPEIKKLLSDSNTAVRYRAADALVVNGDLSGLGVLKLTASDDSAPLLSVEAAGRLAELDDPSGYRTVLKGLHDNSMAVRAMAVVALAKFAKFDGRTVSGETVSVVPQLASVIDLDIDRSIRINAIYTLASFAEGSAKRILEKAKLDKDPNVARAAGVGLTIVENKRKK